MEDRNGKLGFWKKLDEITKVHNPKLKVITSIYPGLAAVLLAFFKDTITRTTKSFIHTISNAIGVKVHDQTIINILVIIYWVVLLIWVLLYFKAVFNESNSNKRNIQDNKKTLDEIYAAIHNAPDRTIFSRYKLLYDEIFDNFQLLHEQIEEKGESVELYNASFQYVLKKICLLTKDFSKKNDAIYGANIMRYLLVEPNLKYVEKLKDNANAWIHFQIVDLKYVRAVLHGTPELIVSGDVKRQVPAITLPIFASGEEVLPGACQAVLQGESFFNDVTDLDNEKGYLDAQRKEAKAFFEGPGNSIKSVISISVPVIGMSQDSIKKRKLAPIVGVLNIDCDMTYPLGKERDYYATYSTLLRPIAYLFSPYLEKYFKLLDGKEI